MSKRSRGRGPTQPRGAGGNPLDGLVSAMLGAAMSGDTAGEPPSGPAADSTGDTMVERMCEVLHRPCSVPFPSLHTATAPHHMKEAADALAAILTARDAPPPVDGPTDPRATAAGRLEEAESIDRQGDLARLATEIRESDTARTRALAAALLGL